MCLTQEGNTEDQRRPQKCISIPVMLGCLPETHIEERYFKKHCLGGTTDSRSYW